ncbi:MAG: S8 family serine peptidase [Firmicutes bacterium]|nr:S8 family serine peptidase [Bacillota bacterium]
MQEYRALDDVSNPWIGADQAWAAGYTGKDLKVAVIDTGIDYNHPDLKDNYLGGFDFVDWDENPMETINPDPELATTHGTHVAGIIAGTGKAKIKGVAPEAKILAYRVLGPGGRGTTDAVVMGIERAVSDGANVLNLSLGNTLNVPDWPTSIALDNAARAGAIPVVAAGNSGPSLWTVGSPGTSRMAITVGASTVPGESITVNEYTPNADPNQPPTVTPLVKGTRMGGSPAFDTLTGSYEMEYVGLGRTTDLSGKNITGKIALIKRGEITFKDKSNNAKEAGAVGAIIFNHLDGDLAGTLGTGDFIPTLGISKAAGEALLAKIAAGTGGTPIKFSFTVNPHDVTLADKIASFSSRGPVSSGGTGFAPPGYELGYQLKPDVLGPGVNILSSVPGAGYAAYSGTSMATPHVAGAALLLKQAHPTWTVQDIKAALMNTAKDLTQPAVAQGAGRIDIMAAAGAGVLLEPDSNVPTGSLNFVFKELPASGATVTQTQMLRVKNTGSGTQTVSLSAYCAPGMTLSFDNPSPSLDAGAGANVAVTASLDSSVAKGFYEGLVTATLSDGTNLRLPVGIFVMPDMIQNFALTPSYVSPNFDNVNDYQAIFWQNTQVLSRFQLEFFAWNGSQWVDQGALLDTATMPSFGIILQPSKWALSWSPEGLPDGLYALQAIGTALDAQTTFAAAPQTFYIDITPPEIVSDLPGEGAVLNDANLSTMVTVNDRPQYPGLEGCGQGGQRLSYTDQRQIRFGRRQTQCV